MKKYIYLYILLTFFVLGFLLFSFSFSFDVYYKYQCSRNPMLNENSELRINNFLSCFLYNDWNEYSAKVMSEYIQAVKNINK